MINLNNRITPEELLPHIKNFWALSAEKISDIQKNYDHTNGSPVFTVNGKYTSRGWTEWTQGFEYGSEILQFDATNVTGFLEKGKTNTLKEMAPHITHFGVHDHGFNNVSTYGNLLRLMNENRIGENRWERNFYELALKCSGAVQARRWTPLPENLGYIYSFNGPHSLFADTIRSLRALAVSHQLGHLLMDENDARISLLERLIQHAVTTAKYTVYYGEGRDIYDICGRTTHESIFNTNDGNFRCPNSQQGYSPFSTWTRGLAWIICGYAEELEFLQTTGEEELEPFGGRETIETIFLKAARATSDFYIENTPPDGIPYWDTGAPLLHKISNPLSQPADPLNPYEPVDSSAAAIAAQGLLRLGHFLSESGRSPDDNDASARYTQAGLTVMRSLLQEPYISSNPSHQGIILHSVYHRPNGWDAAPEGSTVPSGESSMWGDYHAREAALYVQRLAEKGPYLTFFL